MNLHASTTSFRRQTWPLLRILRNMQISAVPGLVVTLLCFAGLTLGLGAAVAQDSHAYPTKPIRIVVPYVPAGLSDTLARAIGQKLTETWGQPVIVENRPGANGAIGSEVVAKSAPDGYTLLLVEGPVLTANPSLYSKLPYNPGKDFAPITVLVSYASVLLVHPSVRANSLSEFLALAKKGRSNSLTYGSFGSGSGGHLNMEWLKSIAGLDIIHVPYKGSAPAVTDLLGGRLSTMLLTVSLAQAHIKSGRVRALAIAAPMRSPLLPEVPTFAEAGLPGYEATSWFGLLSTAGAPKEIIGKLNAEVTRILNEADFKEQRLVKQGIEAVGNTPEEFAALMRSETAKWARVISESGTKLD